MAGVCADQKTFNKAVSNAIYHLDDDDKPKNRVAQMILALIMLSFYLWALLLAMRVQDKDHRILHVTLALLTGPLYVLSYYASCIQP